jgi:Bacterial Ig-like domain
MSYTKGSSFLSTFSERNLYMKTRFTNSISSHERNTAMKRFLILSIPLLMLLLTACPESTPLTATKPTINSFTATPPSLPAGGGSVTLNWDVKDATSLSIDGGVGAVTGTSKTVSVTSNKTFTLTATNAEGSTTQTTSVSVMAGQDTTPPTVISIDPLNGAKAIKEDQLITITFSEQMDQAATEAAYQAPNLPPVTFIWDATGTTLTIQPNEPIPYSYQVETALTYTFSVSGAAKDAAGNSLALFSSSFSTLRGFYTECFGIANLDGYVDTSGSGQAFTGLAPRAGDLRDNAGVRAFFSFDLSACLPEGRILKDAVFNIYKDVGIGIPYSLGDVSLEHVNYGDSLGADDYNTPVLADLDIFDNSFEIPGSRLFSTVTNAVQNDLDNRATRGNRSQFRLRFPVATNNDNSEDWVIYSGSEGGNRDFVPFIQINFLIP